MPNHNHSLQVNWQSVGADSLPQNEQELLDAAAQALDKAYAPYSDFHVGAAVLLDNGEVLSGANFENAAYPMCLCAERSALATAISTYPQAKILQMAIRVRNPKKPVLQPAAPCGACRQVMVEAEHRQNGDIKVFLQGESGPVYVLDSAKVLLPFYFDGSFLG
jgi:cytidine deaminase